MTQLLEIKNLKKSFAQPEGGRLVVLDIPEFQIAKGEQMALIGRSGGGKTTLLHLIAGLLAPDQGSIRIGGIETNGLSEQGRDRFRAETIGYVFQTFNLLPAFTAIENVRLGMAFGSGKHQHSRAADLLTRVGLQDRFNYRPRQLSVGQQQRVAIARSLAGRPKLLLADEPTANVDPSSAESVLELIRETCREEEVSLLTVTHDMQIASRFDGIRELDEINQVDHTSTSSA